MSCLLLAVPLASMAQEEMPATVSYFSNALFNTLLVSIIVLAILIIALAGVMKNIAGSEMFTEKLRKRLEAAKKSGGKPPLLLLGGLLFMSYSAYAGNAGPADDRIGGIDQPTFYTMLALIILELIFVVVMVQNIQQFLKADRVAESASVAETRPREKTIMDALTDAVDVENEESILMDHDYDGIKELDNNLPPWWKYGFYLTIVFAFVYLIIYHITGSAPLQAEEYRKEVKKAEAEIAAFLKNSANNVDENTVILLNKPEDMASGKSLFIGSCALCHGKLGEGGAGPNLTDDYWLHSGGIRDIFKSIKYGYPDKAMKSWKDDFTPVQIAQMVSYIKSLKGTNPPNAKGPQGDIYTEAAAAPADSSAVPADSTKAKLADTTAGKSK